MSYACHLKPPGLWCHGPPTPLPQPTCLTQDEAACNGRSQMAHGWHFSVLCRVFLQKPSKHRRGGLYGKHRPQASDQLQAHHSHLPTVPPFLSVVHFLSYLHPQLHSLLLQFFFKSSPQSSSIFSAAPIYSFAIVTPLLGYQLQVTALFRSYCPLRSNYQC